VNLSVKQGAFEGIQTPNLLSVVQMLYPLSYSRLERKTRVFHCFHRTGSDIWCQITVSICVSKSHLLLVKGKHPTHGVSIFVSKSATPLALQNRIRTRLPWTQEMGVSSRRIPRTILPRVVCPLTFEWYRLSMWSATNKFLLEK
jgi:hypothetical protein